MTRHSRRHFMGLSGAGIAGLMPGNQALAQISSAPEPDLVLINGKVYTVDPLEPRAEALAVKGGRFVPSARPRRSSRWLAGARRSSTPGR